MLTDPNQSDEFKSSEHWDTPLLDFRITVSDSNSGSGTVTKSNSFSGNERNRLVMNSGDGFKDRSLVSGIDCKEDARSFAILDYDGDGWLDIALASVNGQRLRLFRNKFGTFGEGGRVVDVVRGRRGLDDPLPSPLLLRRQIPPKPFRVPLLPI